MEYLQENVVDFDKSEPDPLHDYSGSDRKEPRLIDGIPFMVKYSDKRAKTGRLDTSFVNNTLSEYIGSHLVASAGLPSHETYLGYFNGELVVGCRNYLWGREVSHEFAYYMKKKYDSSEIGRLPKYEQIYDVIETDPELKKIRDEAVRRYWETFIVDAWIANFDRHKGNWSYIYNPDEKISYPAPVYDCGSTLYPALSEKGMSLVLGSEYEIRKRIRVFPNAALLVNGMKVGYYEMISSGIDRNCTDALMSIVPRIDMEKAREIIDNTPLISDTRKQFYYTMLKRRKEMILDRAYKIVREKGFDKESRTAIEQRRPYTDKDLQDDMIREGIDILQLDCGDEEKNIQVTKKTRKKRR